VGELTRAVVRASTRSYRNNYTDHQIIIAATAHVEGQPNDTGDAIIRGNPETIGRLMEEHQKTGKGVFAWNFADGGAKLRPISR